MTKITILEILKNLSLIFEYFVPGYLSVLIFTYFLNKKISSINYAIISIGISCMLKAACGLMHKFIFTQYYFYDYTRIAILCAIAVILSYLMAILFISTSVSDLILKAGYKSIYDSFWDNFVMSKDVAVIQIYKNNKIFLGSVKYFEEDTSEPYVAIVNYTIRNMDGQLIAEPNFVNEALIVKIKDVDYIKFYTSQTLLDGKNNSTNDDK